MSKAWPWLTAMMILQTAWLASIVITKASSQNALVLGLIAWTLAGGSLCLFFSQKSDFNFEPPRESLQLVLLLAAAATVCLVYSFWQRPWPDEGRWLQFDSLVRSGGITGLIDRMLNDDVGARLHSPLPVIFRGYLTRLLPDGLGYARAAASVAPLGYILLTYLVGRRYYDHRTGLTAGLLLLATPHFARIGASILADLWVSFFFCLAILLGQTCLERPALGRFLGLGLVLGLGLLSKYTMVFAFPLLLVMAWIFGAGWRSLPWLALSFLVASALFAPWVFLVYKAGILQVQGAEMFSLASQWVKHGGPTTWTLESIFTRFPTAIGVYMFPLIVLGATVLRPLKSRSDLFIVLWILAVFIPVIFTTPDSRYLMPAFPALTIVAARGIGGVKGGWNLALASVVFALGSWYLFMDWQRTALLF